MKKQPNRFEIKLTDLYNEEVRRGVIREVPAQRRNELVERFISFYSKFDKRLRNIQRGKVLVSYTKNGLIRVCCTYYNKYYGNVYEL